MTVLSAGLRKAVRCNQNVFPQAAFRDLNCSLAVLWTTNPAQSRCLYHETNTNHKGGDTIAAFVGSGYPSCIVGVKENPQEAMPGHLHCGCDQEAGVFDNFFFHTAHAASTNVKINQELLKQGTSPWQKMKKPVHPTFRAFFLEFVRNLSGLQVADFFASDYGLPAYAIRLAILQLYAHIERLLLLGVKVKVVFGDDAAPTAEPSTSASATPTAEPATSTSATPPTAEPSTSASATPLTAEQSTSSSASTPTPQPVTSAQPLRDTKDLEQYGRELQGTGDVDLRSAAKIYADLQGSRAIKPFFMWADMVDEA